MIGAERIVYENAYYHVMSRGRGRQSIFPDEIYYVGSPNKPGNLNNSWGLIEK